jgi:hypothetical protein
MKRIPAIIGTVSILLFVGCASTPVVVSPIGPNPNRPESQSANGQLEVFSAQTGRTEGDNPTWLQHTDYTIYNQQGQAVKRVRNTVGYYATAPHVISLPPGKYLVKAEAKDYPDVTVPVIIDRGRLTRVHLDDAWRTPAVSVNSFIKLPTGNPVGWSPDAK